MGGDGRPPLFRLALPAHHEDAAQHEGRSGRLYPAQCFAQHDIAQVERGHRSDRADEGGTRGADMAHAIGEQGGGQDGADHREDQAQPPGTGTQAGQAGQRRAARAGPADADDCSGERAPNQVGDGRGKRDAVGGAAAFEGRAGEGKLVRAEILVGLDQDAAVRRLGDRVGVALLAGREPAAAETPTFGCPLPRAAKR